MSFTELDRAEAQDLRRRREPTDRRPKKSEEQARRLAAITELVQQARANGDSLTGPSGLLKDLTKMVLEVSLEEEMAEHLGHGKHETVAAPRSKLTTRAAWWAIEQIRREHASVNGIRWQLGTTWRTVWESIRPLLEAAEADPARFGDVTVLGVDEHIWHHVSTKPISAGGWGPKELTGMVDLTRDVHGRTRARLLAARAGSGVHYGGS